MSEKESSLDLSGFFKHSSIYALGNIATRVGSFLLLPLYTHYMTVSDYGALELFYVTSSVISSLLSAGLAHATLRFYYEYKEKRDRNQVVTSCIISTLLYSVPFVAALSFWKVPLARVVFGDASLSRGFNWVFMILVLELLRQIGLAYFRAREYSTMYVVVCLLQLVVQVCCNVYTVGVQKSGVIGVLMGNFLSVLVGCSFIMFVVIRECGISYDWTKMKVIFKYSYPFLLTAMFGMVLSNLDRIILRAFFSLTEVGLYALAYKFGTLIQELIIEPYTRNFGAYRFKIMKDANVKEHLLKLYNQVLLILVIAGLGVSLFSRDVMRIMTAPGFWDAYRTVPWIVLSFIVQGIGYSFQTGILYEKKTKWLIHINLFSSSINVFLYLILIPKFGPVGAGLSVLCKSILEAAMTYIASHRCYPLDYDFIRTYKTIGIAVIFVVALRLFNSTSVWIGLAISAALMIFFPFALYQTGAVERAEVLEYKSMAVKGLNAVKRLRSRG